MKNFFIIILRTLPLLLGAVGLYYFAENQWSPDNRPSPVSAVSATKGIGQPALDFTLSVYGRPGEKFTLSSLRGQAMILNFWATWCLPCIKEMPELLKVAKRYKSQGLKIVAVSIDKNEKLIERFFKRYPKLNAIKDEFTLVIDPKSETALQYGTARYPETYLIDRKFMIQNKFSGEQPWAAAGYMRYYQKILQK